MPKIKRTTLTNEQKLLVLKYKDSNPNATHVNVAQWVKTTLNLDIHPTTVGRLLKQNDIKECEKSLIPKDYELFNILILKTQCMNGSYSIKLMLH